VKIVCPMCKRVIENAPDDFAPRPFCSARCKFADLDQWLSESYRISSPLAVSEFDTDDEDQSSVRRGRTD
jgi:endogenous inhibitor of DNA gyrase (YacG/DUF329 family)